MARGLAVRKAAVVQATWDRLPVVVFFKSVQNSTKRSKWAQDSMKSFCCRICIRLNSALVAEFSVSENLRVFDFYNFPFHFRPSSAPLGKLT